MYDELVVKPLREADKSLSSESANARISTWSTICARPRYFNRRVAAERAVYAMMVVIRLEVRKLSLHDKRIPEEDMVKVFTANGSDETLDEGMRAEHIKSLLNNLQLWQHRLIQ